MMAMAVDGEGELLGANASFCRLHLLTFAIAMKLRHLNGDGTWLRCRGQIRGPTDHINMRNLHVGAEAREGKSISVSSTLGFLC